MKIQRAAEDYLEAMLIVKERCGYIRSVDVARQLGVTKPSVSCATKRLRENGLIVMDSGGYISLTKAGMEIAVRIDAPVSYTHLDVYKRQVPTTPLSKYS